MAKTIVIHKKNTSAGTDYWSIPKADEDYIYRWLNQLNADMNENCMFDQDLRDAWYAPVKSLPRAKRGANSYASICGGICSARWQSPKKNLSTPQLEAVVELFGFVETMYAQSYEKPESIVFEEDVNYTPKSPLEQMAARLQ